MDYKKQLDELEFNSTDADIDCGGAHMDAIEVARAIFKELDTLRNVLGEYAESLYDTNEDKCAGCTNDISEMIDHILAGRVHITHDPDYKYAPK